MTELLSGFNPGELIGLVAVTGGLLCGLVCGTTAIIMDHWHKIRQADILGSLKLDMLKRGMSAEEIHTVVEAGAEGARKDRPSRHSCCG